MISFKKISICNFFQTCLLNPGKKNKKYIKSNFISIMTSIFEKDSKVFAIYDNKTIIGFFMLSKFIKPVYIHRFMIDQKYQNKGYGYESMIKILYHIRDNYETNKVVLSTSNQIAKKLYRKCGFYYIYTEPYVEMYNKYGEDLMEYTFS